MKINSPPASPVRPTFGPWADQPPETWTDDQRAEYTEAMDKYRQETCDFLKSVGGLAGGLTDFANATCPSATPKAD